MSSLSSPERRWRDLDVSSLTRDQAAALAEVTVEDFVDRCGEDAHAVKRVKFKLHDKRAALVDLGRHLGLFETKRKHDGKVEVEISDVRDTILKRLARFADARTAASSGIELVAGTSAKALP